MNETNETNETNGTNGTNGTKNGGRAGRMTLPGLEIVEITDAAGQVIAPAWLAKARGVHAQLRPRLEDDYVGQMHRVFAGGARMTIAAQGDRVVGLAVHRCYENTVDGPQMYVDDLVTDEALRSRGVGRALLEHLAATSRALGLNTLRLDSGTHRERAHKLYFETGFTIVAFHFRRPLR